MTLVDRASPTDRAFLVMDRGPVPEQLGVVLLLDRAAHLDLASTRRLVEQRLDAVPRLRQRLVRAPLGGGGPLWVDDDAFDVRRHVRALDCDDPGDEAALMREALAQVMRPLPRDAPLWSVGLVTGRPSGGAALVVVLHHVLADGVGGLAVLGALVDPDPPASHPVPARDPQPRPPTTRLVADAWRRRVRAAHEVVPSLRLLRSSMSASGGLAPPAAARSSLVRRTGPHRAVSVVRVPVAPLAAAAHRHGATTNDALLVAVAAALHDVLLVRGERVDPLLVAVPVSGRSDGDAAALGNQVSPLLLAVPTTGDLGGRLEQVAAAVRANHAAATGPPPIALLGGGFRLLARAGGYQWYMRHQHRLHTLVSHVRGPHAPVCFGGAPVTAAVPIAVSENGNLTVCFLVLTYAGTVTISAVVDPDRFPDLDVLAAGLRRQLDLVVRSPATRYPRTGS